MFVTAPKSLSFPAVQIITGAIVAPGETVEVPDEVGVSLIDQGWTEAAASKPRKRTAKKATAAKQSATKTEAASAADDPAPSGDDPKES